MGQEQTLRGEYASRLLSNHIIAKFAERTRNHPDRVELPERSIAAPEGNLRDVPFDGKVCIVGAGASGIYLAWMLTYLNIPYDLFEASDRIGGRCYTYDGFKNDKPDNFSQHNYYDVGAMRIPRIDSMES